MSVRSECRLGQRARSFERSLGNRPTGGRLDRPHRPAARSDPKLLAVPPATELLSRSARGTWFESSATPQAASMQELLGRFEPCGNRPAIRVFGNECGFPSAPESVDVPTPRPAEGE